MIRANTPKGEAAGAGTIGTVRTGVAVGVDVGVSVGVQVGVPVGV
jgi:hypothetical protein